MREGGREPAAALARAAALAGLGSGGAAERSGVGAVGGEVDVDDGVVDGLTSAEQAEIVQLRRRARQLEMENEILRRAAAYFASATLPK